MFPPQTDFYQNGTGQLRPHETRVKLKVILLQAHPIGGRKIKGPRKGAKKITALPGELEHYTGYI